MGRRLYIGLLMGAATALLSLKGITQPAGRGILTLSPADPEFQSGRYYFHDYLYAFVDSTENRTIEEVAAPAFQPRFTREECWRAGNFGGDLGMDIRYIWARLTIHSRLAYDEDWLINIFAGEADLFVPVDSNRFVHYRSGGSLPLRERAFEGDYGLLPCLPLRLPAEDTLTVFFRLKSTGSVGAGPRGAFNLALFKPQAYMALDRRIRFFDALIIGIMLAVVAYHLIIFLYQRQYVSLFFSLFVLAFSLIIMEFRGYGHEILLPGYDIKNGIVLTPITWSTVYLCHYCFSRLYLKLPQLVPAWDKIWAGVILIDIVSAAMLVQMILSAGDFTNVAPDPFFRLVSFRVLIGTLLLFTIIIAAVAAWFKGSKDAGIYLLAMLTFVLQELANNTNAWFGLLDLPPYLYGYIGQTLMVLLFAMGIARQLKTLQEEKMAAEQAELIERAETNRIRELDAFKSRFYTNMTHQFRTPLTIILGMAGQIQAHPSAWLNKGPEMIRRNGRRLLQLVDQILTLSRLEARQLPARFVQDDVIRYIKYIVGSFHYPAEQKNIRLQFISEPDELAVDYEPDKLMDILSNLISNAIKFTPEGGSVWVRVQVKTEAAEALCIQVEDNGPGIHEAALPHVFDRFYSLPPTPSKGEGEAEAGLLKTGRGRRSSPLGGGWEGVSSSPPSGWLGGAGTGIGLALTRELVHFLKGEITVESEPGRGTVFSITLPITRSATAGHNFDRPAIREAIRAYVPIPKTRFYSEEEKAAPEQCTVLIVEDNRDMVEYIRSILSPRFDIEIEFDGEKGLAKALLLIPDIIISDIMMPAMDGLEMCRQLKADRRTSHIPVILLTAKADIASRVEGLRIGADAYLSKPFDQAELLVQIDNLLVLRQQLQERYRDLSFLFHPKQTLAVEDMHPEGRFMRELHTIIEDNLSDPDFHVIQLCEQIGMSRALLYKKFKALSNQTIADFIRRVRLHRARQLLQTTSLNVTQVAMDVGFKTLSNFSRRFTEEFGINPSEVKNADKPTNI